MYTSPELTRFPVADGAGSVSQAPDLPEGFADTFTSRYIEANGIRQHVVVGGQGPALVLVHGWPQTWYAWRLLMPKLAKRFTVIAPDQRGIGLSERARSGYDSTTLAADVIGVVDALGIDRFAVAGHDTGFIISYALVADYADRVDRVALAEIPGPPAPSNTPPLFVPSHLNAKLWHIPFNRADDLPEQLIAGREDVFFGYEFAIQGGGLPTELIEFYVGLVSDPESLRGSLGFYRAWDATLEQNAERVTRKLMLPVLAVGGERSYGGLVEHAMSALADDVEGVVIDGAGHWLAEEAPEQLLASFNRFFEPYRAAATADLVEAPAVR
ncbi:alpha/beta fold hydrolase [Agromyces humatus]|uniref:Alpha/beta hydrolase n=1 Tax=Agromyces humatus TaxID=279573 RepID=A0ABN2KBK2_9MICO|nr:alpha/beta hydrolase [Agromyces humatus]